jgi:hypothetical protein
MTDERLQDWLEGRLDDEDLTLKEAKHIEKMVFKAIAKKQLERTDVFTFAQHRNVQ